MIYFIIGIFGIFGYSSTYDPWPSSAAVCSRWLLLYSHRPIAPHLSTLSSSHKQHKQHCVLRRIALCTVFCITVHWWCSARLVPELIIETGEFGKTGGEIGVDNNQVKPTNSSQFCQTGPPQNPTFLLLFSPRPKRTPRPHTWCPSPRL